MSCLSSGWPRWVTSTVPEWMTKSPGETSPVVKMEIAFRVSCVLSEAFEPRDVGGFQYRKHLRAALFDNRPQRL